MRGYYPDYDLIDQIQRRNEKNANEYVRRCPHLAGMRRFAEDNAEWYVTTRQAEMERIRLDPARGLVTFRDGTSITADTADGEI